MEKPKQGKNVQGENEFYDDISEIANFINDRLENVIAPGGLNKTVDEYVKEDKGK